MSSHVSRALVRWFVVCNCGKGLSVPDDVRHEDYLDPRPTRSIHKFGQRRLIPAVSTDSNWPPQHDRRQTLWSDFERLWAEREHGVDSSCLTNAAESSTLVNYLTLLAHRWRGSLLEDGGFCFGDALYKHSRSTGSTVSTRSDSWDEYEGGCIIWVLEVLGWQIPENTQM